MNDEAELKTKQLTKIYPMKRFIPICSLLMATIAVNAQPTLDECHKLARNHYPEIRQYDLIGQTEQYSLSNASRAWLPQITLGAQATWQNNVPTLPGTLTSMLAQQGVDLPGLTKDQYKITLEVNQTIWDGGKTAANKRIAQANTTEQVNATKVDLYAIEGRVNNIYFGIMLLDERITQTRTVIELLNSTLQKIRSLQKNGVAMQDDSDDLEAEQLLVNQQLTQLLAMRESYCRMLGILIGQEIGDKKLAPPDVLEPVSQGIARPELAFFDAKIGTLAAQQQLVKTSTRPHFAFFAQGYYGYPGMDYFDAMTNSDWSFNALIGIKMMWNIGSYYTKKNTLSKIAIAQQQVNVQRDVFLFNTQLQTAEENGNISRLRKAIADDERIVKLRRAVREAAESKLRNGIIDTNDLLRKITDESNAETARTAREIELAKAIYELKHTINQ